MAGYASAVRYSKRRASITHKQVIIWLIRASGLRARRAGRSSALDVLCGITERRRHRRDVAIIKAAESNVAIPE